MPTDISYEEIKQLLLEHFKPKRLVVVESYRFYKTKQEDGEPFSNCFVQLKHLASPCEFSSFLETALGDKFVYGLTDEIILKRLLSEDIIKKNFQGSYSSGISGHKCSTDTEYLRIFLEGNKNTTKVCSAFGNEGRKQEKCPTW